MNDWSSFTKTQQEIEAAGGSLPKVQRYLAIKLIDNGLLTTSVVLLICFTIGGIISETYSKDKSTSVLFDFAKVTLGVFLGAVAGRYKTPGKR